jgi:predicted O-methyltransferase YrrM
MKYIDRLPRHKYQWIPLLYSLVHSLKPKKIIEYGTEWGGTAITMGLALKDLYETEQHLGKVYTYDTFEVQSKGEIGAVNNMRQFGVSDFVEVNRGDFFDFCAQEEKEFDLLYFDIDNDGEKVLEMYEGCKNQIQAGSVVLFEGGSTVRDDVKWMQDYNKRKIESIKEITGYKLLTPNTKYSVSIIYNPDIYNLEL